MTTKGQTGVALVQVLFITSILALMALHFTLTSRQQVNIATIMQDKISAELALLNWQNELFYALLTQATSGGSDEKPKPNLISRNWNFYGKPFSPEQNVKMRIQDAYGLVSLSMPGQQTEISQLLQQLSYGEDDIRRIIAELDRRQSFNSRIYQPNTSNSDYRIPMQSVMELKTMTGITEQNFEELKELVTVLPVGTFNPLTSPDIRLKSLLPAETAEKVIQLREAGQLDAAAYIALSGIDDFEQMSFVPGQLLIMSVEVVHGAAVAKSHFICYIRPENQFPLIWLD